jgi:hypothetical protein
MTGICGLLGILIIIALIAGGIWLVIASIFYEHVTLEIPTGLCPTCNYNLEGLPSPGTCPECGNSYRSASRIVKKYQPDPERLPTVAAILLLSFLSFAALLALPFLTALVAYVLLTDWPLKECVTYASLAPTFDGDYFIPLLAFQTWVLCVIAVRIPFRLGVRFVLAVILGGILGMFARLPFFDTFNQGMFVYFESNKRLPLDYIFGALLGTTLWCIIYSKSIKKLASTTAAEQSAQPPPQDPK